MRRTFPGNRQADKHPDSKHRSGNSPPNNSSGRQPPGQQTPVRQSPRPKSDTGEAAKNSPHGRQAVRGIARAILISK
ncbi:hypothetical protein KML24008_07050 [Alistipes onderdonkii]